MSKHPDFKNNPFLSDNPLIKPIAKHRIYDTMELTSLTKSAILTNVMELTSSTKSAILTNVTIAIGDINLITFLLTWGATATPITRRIIQTRLYSTKGLSYSVTTKKTIYNLLDTFSSDVFERGSDSNLSLEITRWTSVPARPYSFDSYNIEVHRDSSHESRYYGVRWKIRNIIIQILCLLFILILIIFFFREK